MCHLADFSHRCLAVTGLCLGVYDAKLQLRSCNTRSLRQRWSLLHERAAKGISDEDAELNRQRAYNASLVCEIGMD